MAKEIIVHCSKSYYGNALLINDWHRQRGFKEIGYHYIILNGKPWDSEYYEKLDGIIETGRNRKKDGAHCRGHNETTGICLIGQSHSFTSRQIASLLFILKFEKELNGSIKVNQHSCYDIEKPFCAGFTEDEIKNFNI